MTTPNDLWFQASQDPVLLPTGVVFDESTGLSWSDLANNPAGRTALGWTKAPDFPTYNEETEIPVWDTVDEDWVVTDLPPPVDAPAPTTVTRLQYIMALKSVEVSPGVTGFDIVFGAVDALDPQDDTRIYFLNTPTFNRLDTRYEAMEDILTSSPENSAEFFVYAATFPP